MNKIEQVSEDTQSLVDFIRSLPSAKNVRVYTQEQQKSLVLERETAAVRRSVIRFKNQGSR